MQKISKILKWLATGSAALAIAACYGVLYTYKQLVVKVTNKDDKPISGLQVTCKHKPMDFCLDTETNDSGETLFHLEEDGAADLYVQDTDGPDNSGYFKSQYREVKQVTDGDMVSFLMEEQSVSCKLTLKTSDQQIYSGAEVFIWDGSTETPILPEDDVYRIPVYPGSDYRLRIKNGDETLQFSVDELEVVDFSPCKGEFSIYLQPLGAEEGQGDNFKKGFVEIFDDLGRNYLTDSYISNIRSIILFKGNESSGLNFEDCDVLEIDVDVACVSSLSIQWFDVLGQVKTRDFRIFPGHQKIMLY